MIRVLVATVFRKLIRVRAITATRETATQDISCAV